MSNQKEQNLESLKDSAENSYMNQSEQLHSRSNEQQYQQQQQQRPAIQQILSLSPLQQQSSQNIQNIELEPSLNQQTTLPGRNVIVFPKLNSKNQLIANKKYDARQQEISLSDSFPWMNQKTLSIENPLIKLHNEMIDYFIAYQEDQDTHNHLMGVFNKLQALIFKTFMNCQILAPFLTNKVYLKNSQVQIFLLFGQQSWKAPQTIEKVKQCLQKCKFQQIKFFEVPPFQNSNKQHKIGFNCVSNERKYPVQIKLVSQQWISYISMINDVLENNLESKFLFFIFDTIIRQRGLQNSVKSYLTFGLISVFIHERKRQKSRSLTQNLLKFLQYFGIGPFTQRKICYLGRNEFEIKQDGQQNYNSGNNSITFSFWINENIDISTHMVKQFFSILRNRYRLISNFNFHRSPSILAALINPSEEQFRY